MKRFNFAKLVPMKRQEVSMEEAVRPMIEKSQHLRVNIQEELENLKGFMMEEEKRKEEFRQKFREEFDRKMKK